jgi:hypothetical protein
MDRTFLQQLLTLWTVLALLLLPAGSSLSPLLPSDGVAEAITALALPAGEPTEDGGGTVEVDAFAEAALPCAVLPARPVSCRVGLPSPRRTPRFSLVPAAPRAPPSLAG